MRRRLLRLVVVLGLGAWIGIPVPVDATTAGLLFFDSTVTLACPGLDFVFVNGKVPHAPVVVADLPLPPDTPLDLVPNFHLDWGGNRCPIAAVGPPRLCGINDINILKPPKAFLHTNVGCGFGLGAPLGPNGNTVTGFCGLSGGQVSIVLHDGLGQTFDLDLHFIGGIPTPAQMLTFLGHITKRNNGDRGLIMGASTAIPIPTTVGPPPSGNSCMAKTATVFTLTGFLKFTTT